MHSIRGKVVLKESGKGIPNLLVVAYDVDARKQWEALTGEQSAALSHLGSSPRLGSVITDENGKFELEYEGASPGRFFRKKITDLSLVVAAPEDPSLGCSPPVLHVSCVPRANAGPVESYMITLPLEWLDKAGVSTPRMAPPKAVRTDMLLASMKALGDQRQERRRAEEPFSVRYKEKRAQIVTGVSKHQPLQKPPQSFELAMPVELTEGEARQEMQISQDESTGHLLLASERGAEPAAPAFQGVERTTDRKGICLLIDPERREFRLCLPNSPSKLEAPSGQPSLLYWWYKQQIRDHRKHKNAVTEDTVPVQPR